jgi:hypothetical protein
MVASDSIKGKLQSMKHNLPTNVSISDYTVTKQTGTGTTEIQHWTADFRQT